MANFISLFLYVIGKVCFYLKKKCVDKYLLIFILKWIKLNYYKTVKNLRGEKIAARFTTALRKCLCA